MIACFLGDHGKELFIDNSAAVGIRRKRRGSMYLEGVDEVCRSV
jgi:hypothetical protein